MPPLATYCKQSPPPHCREPCESNAVGRCVPLAAAVVATGAYAAAMARCGSSVAAACCCGGASASAAAAGGTTGRRAAPLGTKAEVAVTLLRCARSNGVRWGDSSCWFCGDRPRWGRGGAGPERPRCTSAMWPDGC